jgi:membrane protein implicated in regulation of membrane protease activity
VSALAWGIIAVICGIVEILTLGFWFIWLSLSAFVVAICVKIGLISALNNQLLLFACFTLLLLVFTRPIVMKFVKHKEHVSNVQALIGQQGQVTKAITRLDFGQVKLNGEIWTAASEEEIDVQAKVSVVGIDGVKLVVKKLSEQDAHLEGD